MKKILSLALAALMLVSAIPVAYATGEPSDASCTCGAQLETCPICGIDYVYCPTCDDDACSVCSDGGSDNNPTIPEVGTTTVTLVGSASQSYYEVEVPASMAPGGNADITVEGTWKSTETLKVSAPEKVTLYYGDQSMDVAIDFDGISQVGNDKVDSTASATLTLADASVKFGTWTGVIEYTVELV